ncbi:TOM1-like protein 5 isoform X2 [Dendrobium catenatum]|uniref:TOM1-like protein 5 isoform X2 n=1 Tax=Dendrobium catenatum TaxID=906689 RepID=UPI0009F29B4D|nr:TOM1-like protein 5 isoform X2 [Dendrobium catenatum]
MAAEMVKSATSEKLMDMDWTKSIEICELVAKDHGQAKDVVKCVKKRLGHKNANTQLFTVRLLEMLMNNCGEHIHRLVIDNGLLPILVKIVKKKTNLPVRERIFLLLDATQTSLGGAEGRYPQYYTAYYDLVASRVQFPQRSHIQSTQQFQAKEINEHLKDLTAEVSMSNRCQDAAKEPSSQAEHSIIHKATSVMEVLMETLNALTPRRPEGAAGEFILDLVEQCSFQKQRVMHLVMTCQICKGKALAEDNLEFLGSSLRYISDEELGRPLARPLCIQPNDQDSIPRLPHHPLGSIPPPPAKHMERERFFKGKHLDGPAIVGNMKSLSVHSRTGSSSRSGSTDFSDTIDFHG